MKNGNIEGHIFKVTVVDKLSSFVRMSPSSLSVCLVSVSLCRLLSNSISAGAFGDDVSIVAVVVAFFTGDDVVPPVLLSAVVCCSCVIKAEAIADVVPVAPSASAKPLLLSSALGAPLLFSPSFIIPSASAPVAHVRKCCS